MEKETIRSMVSNIIANRETDAMRDFDAAIADKLTDALDHKKQEVASGLGESDKTKYADAPGVAGGSGLTNKLLRVAGAIGDIFTGQLGRDIAAPDAPAGPTQSSGQVDAKPSSQPPEKLPAKPDAPKKSK